MIVWLGAGVIAAAVAPFVWWLILKSRGDQVPLGHAELKVALGLDQATLAPQDEGGTGLWHKTRRVLASVRPRLPTLLSWGQARLDPSSPRGLALTLSVGALAVATWVFSGLTQDVLGHDDAVLADPRVERLVGAHRISGLTAAMKVLTWLGSTALLVPAVLP